MSIAYTKPALTFEEQLEQLRERGLVVNNKPYAIAKLSTISYYRLSAYWYPFRVRDSLKNVTDVFLPHTNFESCLALYEFDRKLRLLMLDAIERIEVAIRTKITYYLAHQYGAFGYYDSAIFNPKFRHSKWIEDINKEVTRSRDEFVTHYRKKYQDFPKLPIWMLTEIMSLGNLSKLYFGMNNNDKKIIAKKFHIHYRTLAHWLHTITYIRNICAHHSRLWNRPLSIKPVNLKDPNWLPPLTPRSDRLFYALLILRYLLKITDNSNDWHHTVSELIKPFTEKVTYRAAMGIPENWRAHPIWRDQ